MSGAPKTTVVTIVLNGERFLHEAIESVLAQTSPDWELLVVDDGSTDGTAAIAAEHESREAGRVRVLRHPGGANRGMSASRNLGLQEAAGAYVTFLDHDDVMLPPKIEEQSALLDEHPDVASVVGPNLRWCSWSGGEGGRDEVQDLGVPVDTVMPPPGPLPVFLADSRATPQGFMVRRTAIDRVGGYEEAFTGMYEDQVLQAKLYLEFPVYVCGTVWHRYRQHDDSCVSRTLRTDRRLIVRRRFLRWLLRYVEGRDADDLRRTIHAELARTRFARTRRAIGNARRGLSRVIRGTESP